MEKNKIKIIVIIAIVLLLYVGIIYLVNRNVRKDARKVDEEDALLLTKDYMYIKSEGKWFFANETDYNSALNRKKFQIYSKGNYIGTYKIKYVNYFFQYDDGNDRDIQVEYPAIFYASENNTIEEHTFNAQDLTETDDKIVKGLLDNSVYYPSSKYEFTDKTKYVFDYDNDGVNETLLFVSTGHSDGFSDSEKVFRMVLYIDGSEVQAVYKDIATRGTDEADFYEYSLVNLFKISNQSTYTIVLSKTLPMSGLSYCPTILEFNGNKLEEQATCEEANS